MDRKHIMMCIEMTKAIQEKNYHAVLRLLDEENLDVDSELMLHKYPIMISIESNAITIGKFLISRGCSLSLKNVQGLTPLLLAVQLLNFDFVKLLLDNRADLTSQDNEGRTALHLAAQMNSLRMVQLLMKNPSVSCVLKMLDKEGKTPFMYACAHGSQSLISYILDKGECSVNEAYGQFQDTPLLTLISNYNCSSEIINKILDAGANINHLNKLNETPLLKAFHELKSNNKLFHHICALLIMRGSRVNVRNSLGDTPLHIAVSMNNETLVRKLLNAGSLVNVTNNFGLTPLFYACKKGLQKIASLLLDCGADGKVIDCLASEYEWLLQNESLLYPNTCSVLSYVFNKSRECRDLRSSCRLVIRRNLVESIDRSALELPLPPSLVKFILLC
ncbi:serine/threonine-protein phosphatase 6 regulatory ankyrin repeat subunit A isoform X2 [Parasteatoda tepidariorum]|nr:serine/threonine-protein phosphatase 6 regulatory ankyrin repeat subunit B isoform X2 [Parasteatoda tepidariorum]XP_015927906.1 serine/threonine-protein phosphatase 6 regulatory ankyrin repeat subunit B isoform X2 [Parasteatoda tepidariorum]XP_042908376.1 serine/threonine-protein phosphatase 6 regulatory ankyrin repeat subunit B isoform X2 [Parasteatoda tepidariorum]